MKAAPLLSLALCLAAPCFAVGSTPAPGSPAAPTAAAKPARSISVEFLRVHPRSEMLIAEGVTSVPGYRLAERSRSEGADGQLWIQAGEAAAAEGCRINETDVAEARPDEARPGYLLLRFSPEGARKLLHLTSTCALGRDRLAVVVNGKVHADPIVHGVLEHEVMISGLGEALCEEMAQALNAGLEEEHWEAEEGGD